MDLSLNRDADDGVDLPQWDLQLHSNISHVSRQIIHSGVTRKVSEHYLTLHSGLSYQYFVLCHLINITNCIGTHVDGVCDSSKV